MENKFEKNLKISKYSNDLFIRDRKFQFETVT